MNEKKKAFFFGRKIEVARCRAGLTQHQVAIEVGCSQGAISDYENGEYWPPLDVAVKIARLLSLDLNDFDGGE